MLCSRVNFEFPYEGVFHYGMSRKTSFSKSQSLTCAERDGIEMDGWASEEGCVLREKEVAAAAAVMRGGREEETRELSSF